MNNRSDDIEQVINELRNGDYADIFQTMVTGMTLFRTITLSENGDVEASIVASLITSGWLNHDEQGRVRLLADEAEYISRSLSHDRTMLDFLAPGRITPEMGTSISNIIRDIINWIQTHTDNENNSQSSSSRSSSLDSINSRSDQGNYSGEEPDINDVLEMGSEGSERSDFNTPVPSDNDDDDDVDSESSDYDDSRPYEAQGGKSKMTRKSKISKKTRKSKNLKKSHKSRKSKRGGNSKKSKKSKKNKTKRRKH